MHVLDMKRTINNGKWQGEIGKAKRSTIRVFTGERMSGTELTNFYASGSPENTTLTVYGPDGDIYISFEQLETYVAPPINRIYIDEEAINVLLKRINDLENVSYDLKNLSQAFTEENEEWVI